VSSEDNDEVLNCDDLKELLNYDKKILKGVMRGFSKLFILWIIGKERQHGYEIMSKINDFSHSTAGKVSGPSTIYPVLHELEGKGLIKGTWESQGKRKIKYYEITESGEATLVRLKKIFKCHLTPYKEEFLGDMFIKKEEEDF
jgi:DNA-binding PadR family transcriptional regulator